MQKFKGLFLNLLGLLLLSIGILGSSTTLLVAQIYFSIAGVLAIIILLVSMNENMKTFSLSIKPFYGWYVDYLYDLIILSLLFYSSSILTFILYCFVPVITVLVHRKAHVCNT